MRKPTFCICENKEADQRLSFGYSDSTIPLLSKFKISSLQPLSLLVQLGLCLTYSENSVVGFLMMRLTYIFFFNFITLHVHKKLHC